MRSLKSSTETEVLRSYWQFMTRSENFDPKIDPKGS